MSVAPRSPIHGHGAGPTEHAAGTPRPCDPSQLEARVLVVVVAQRGWWYDEVVGGRGV
jgi:hypothetical protein